MSKKRIRSSTLQAAKFLHHCFSLDLLIASFFSRFLTKQTRVCNRDNGLSYFSSRATGRSLDFRSSYHFSSSRHQCRAHDYNLFQCSVGKTATVSKSDFHDSIRNGIPRCSICQKSLERFSLPVATAAWSSPLQAQMLPPACIQQFQSTPHLNLNSTSCTTSSLDKMPRQSSPLAIQMARQFLRARIGSIYTPSNATFTSKKTLMFWNSILSLMNTLGLCSLETSSIWVW